MKEGDSIQFIYVKEWYNPGEIGDSLPLLTSLRGKSFLRGHHNVASRFAPFDV